MGFAGFAPHHFTQVGAIYGMGYRLDAVDANAVQPAGHDGSAAGGEAGAEGFQAGTTTLATN